MININQLAPPATTTEQIETSILATNDNTPSKFVVINDSNHIAYADEANVLQKNKNGWIDIVSDIVLKTSGANIPTYAQFLSTPYYFYKFALNDYCFLNFHLNHGYRGGNIYLHTHFTTDGTNTQPVKFEYTYTIAKGNQQSFNFNSPSVTTSILTPTGTPAYHNISETSTTIDTTNADIDALICVKLRRITNGGTDNTDGVFVICCDCHVQYSENATSTNKSYPFN